MKIFRILFVWSLCISTSLLSCASKEFLYGNESNTGSATSVFFDDFTIIHEKNIYSLRVVESTDYDPFGSILEGTRYVDISRPLNSYLYQGEYAEFEELTGSSRFIGRGNYDAALGRWGSVDPSASMFSDQTPYNSMLNNPVTFNDPDGRCPVCPIIAGGALIGGLMGADKAYRAGDQWYNGFWRGALTGAVGGVLSTFGGGTFLEHVAWGAAEGSITGGLNSMLWNEDIGNGMLKGAAWGGAISAASALNESITNYADGYGFGTNDGRFNKMVRESIYEDSFYDFDTGQTTYGPEVSHDLANKALDYWKLRNGGPSMRLNERMNAFDPETNEIFISKHAFRAGPKFVRSVMAHENGHLIGKINGTLFKESEYTQYLYDRHGYDGYQYAIENAGWFGAGLKGTIGKGVFEHSQDAWKNYSVYSLRPGILKYLYSIPRRKLFGL